MDIGRRILLQRTAQGLTQGELAKKTGVSAKSVGMWERGEREPGSDALRALAAALNSSVAYLMGEANDPTRPKASTLEEEKRTQLATSVIPIPDQVMVKVYALGACAGRGTDNERYDPPMLRAIPMSRRDVGRGDADKIYGIEVTGRSMEPKIHDGDTVIVNENEPPGKTDICYARYWLNGFMHDAIKYYMPMHDGSIELHGADDQVTKPLVFTPEEIKEGHLQILGVIKCKVSVERL